jgi:phenylacetate-CoA ligase
MGANGSTVPRHYFEEPAETMDPALLDAIQWEAFVRQVERASASRFYRDRFARAGFDVSQLKTWDDIRRIPFTSKTDLCDDIQENPPYGTRLVVASEEIVDIVETSGTSGIGREVHVLNAEDRHRAYRIEAFGFVWAGVRHGSVVALTLPVAMTAAGNWWIMTLDRLNANCLRLGQMDVEAKLDYLVRYQPHALIGTPAYVSRLERAALDRGLDLAAELPALQSILVSGEAKSAHWAQERNIVWGARVYEQWGCCAGAVTWSCEGGMVDSAGSLRPMHSLPHLTMLEVIDPATGEHVRDGEYGQIVITPLGMEAAPLVRFATGDRARYVEARHCTCGRPFPGIEASSVSRFDDMVKVKGVNVWPTVVAAVVELHPEILEHRVTVYADASAREQIKLEAVVRDNLGEGFRSEVLIRELKASTGLTFELIVHGVADGVAFQDVMQATSGKVRRWRDLRADDVPAE